MGQFSWSPHVHRQSCLTVTDALSLNVANFKQGDLIYVVSLDDFFIFYPLIGGTVNNVTILATAAGANSRYISISLLPSLAGGAAVHILEGWFIGHGDEIEGGVGANAGPTLLSRFSVPITGQAPLNNYPDTAFWPSVAGTVTELQLVAAVTPTSAGTLTGQVLVNSAPVGTPVVLDTTNPQRNAGVQAIPYVIGDYVEIQYTTVGYAPVLNGLIGMLRIRE